MRVQTPQYLALAQFYIQRNAIAHGTFRLASGAMSDFYIDGRLVTTYPAALKEIANQMATLITERGLLKDNTMLVTPVLSGIPIVVALSLQMTQEYIIDRGQPKDHGHGKRFEGELASASHCLVVDDLVTAGTTLVRTIEGLRAEGKIVTDAIAVVDRQEGGREALARMGVTLHTLLTKGQLLETMEASTLEGSHSNGYAHAGVA